LNVINCAAFVCYEIHEARQRGERKYDYPPQQLSRYRPENPVPEGDRPDVLLDIPNVSVDEISLDVRNVRAHVSLEAKVAKLVHLGVGVDASIDDVNLSILGVKAQALLVVRLHNVRRIVDKVLTSIVQNPRLINRLFGTVDNVVRNVDEIVDTTLQPGGVLEQTVDTLGRTINRTVDKAGNIVEKVIAGPAERPRTIPPQVVQQQRLQQGGRRTAETSQPRQSRKQHREEQYREQYSEMQHGHPPRHHDGEHTLRTRQMVTPQQMGSKDGGRPVDAVEAEQQRQVLQDSFDSDTGSYTGSCTGSYTDSNTASYTSDDGELRSDSFWAAEGTYPLNVEAKYEQELVGWDRPRTTPEGRQEGRRSTRGPAHHSTISDRGSAGAGGSSRRTVGASYDTTARNGPAEGGRGTEGSSDGRQRVNGDRRVTERRHGKGRVI
jgi:hypothetical protein